MESLLQEWLHRANWNVLAWLPWFQIFAPFLYQSIVCVWDSGRRLVLVICKLMITFYWQWAPQKAFVGCKKQNNGGAPGGNLSSIFQVFVKNLGIIWPKWEDKKVDTTRLTPWCEPCQKLKIHVSICWLVLSGMRSLQTRRGPRLRHAALHSQTQLCCKYRYRYRTNTEQI